jgi:hypothetical protein
MIINFMPEGFWLFRRWMQSFAHCLRFSMAGNNMMRAIIVVPFFNVNVSALGTAQSSWVRPKSQMTQHLELFLWGTMSQGMVAPSDCSEY